MTNPAEGYESYMVPALFGPWAAKVVETAKPQGVGRVLDVACATGIAARRVAPRLGPAGSVTGLAASADTLAVARAAAARERIAVEWCAGNAEQLPFPEENFDVVLCQLALMFIADRAAVLAEMRRVRRASGHVVASVWQGLDRHPFYQTLHGVIGRRLGESAVGASSRRAIQMNRGNWH